MKRLAAMLAAVLLLVMPSAAGVSAEETTGTADLIVSELTWSGGDGQVTPGTKLTFSVTVTNQGTVAADVPFFVDIGFGTERLFRLTQSSLAAGASVTLTSPVWTAESGDRMITARANSTNTVPETQRWDNNVAQRNLRVADDRYEPTFDEVKDAVAEAGMFDLTFNDDFNDTVAFDAERTGKEGYKWYCRRHAAFSKLDMAECRAENGILTMDCKIDTFALGAATIDRVTGVGYTFTHGYLEFRLRMPVVGGEDESKTAIWSFPRERYTEKEPFTTHVEMDWMEYYGDNYYTVTLHEQTYEGSKTHWYSSNGGNFNGLGDQQWHTMGYLWEEGSLRCYLDGELFLTQTWSPDDVPMPINVVRSGDIKFDGVFSYADTQDMMLFIFGSSKIPLELDYVRIWQAGGDEPTEPVPPTVVTKPTSTTKKPTVTTTKTSTTTATTSTTSTTSTTASTTVDTTTTDGESVTTTLGGSSTSTTTAGTPSTAPTLERNPKPDTDTGDGVPVWVYIVIGGVLLLGGGAVLCVLLMKKK